MDPKHRQLIISNAKDLVRRIDLGFLIPILIRSEIFTQPMLEDILAKNTDTDRKEMLLMELPTRGPQAFQKFVQVLAQSGNITAAALLDSSIDSTNKQSSVLNNNFIPTTGSEETPDSAHYFVKPAKNWKSGDYIYKMSSTPRGFCLIINNVDFIDYNTYPKREGSDIDARRLKDVFTQLDYDVQVERNLDGGDKMISVMTSFAQKFKGSNVDSCVVIILTHGITGHVVGCDGKGVQLNLIFDLFNNRNCEWLQDKPRLFFIQACRGKNFDVGVPFGASESFDAAAASPDISKLSIEEKPKKLPTVTDTLVSFSTVEGYVSIRHHVFGTWYCVELVLALCEHAHDHNLREILQVVDRNVQQRCSELGEKQATEFRAIGSHKSFYFNPGLKADP